VSEYWQNDLPIKSGLHSPPAANVHCVDEVHGGIPGSLQPPSTAHSPPGDRGSNEDRSTRRRRTRQRCAGPRPPLQDLHTSRGRPSAPRSNPTGTLTRVGPSRWSAAQRRPDPVDPCARPARRGQPSPNAAPKCRLAAAIAQPIRPADTPSRYAQCRSPLAETLAPPSKPSTRDHSPATPHQPSSPRHSPKLSQEPRSTATQLALGLPLLAAHRCVTY
jgi:hypothetical protein